MIVLPFPPASLSGHNKGHWRGKSPIVAQLRQKAHDAAWDANISIPEDGDIRLHVRFIPPNRRGDRVNYWNRCKPIIDGIADALQINDSRFLPSMEFAEPEKPGRVEIEVGSAGDKIFPAGANHAGNSSPPGEQEAA